MKVSFFVDGFNLYHSIAENPQHHKYKWLDLHKLCSLFTTREDQIVDIFYFTAYVTWDQTKVNRHQLYVRALEDKGIKVVIGKFKRKTRFCTLCKKPFLSAEEKRTDVNIAIHLFEGAIYGTYDKAFIISGDSDLIPAIEAIKRTFPTKQIITIFPFGRRAKELKSVSDGSMKIKLKHFQQAQFPDSVITKRGVVLNRPPSWS